MKRTIGLFTVAIIIGIVANGVGRSIAGDAWNGVAWEAGWVGGSTSSLFVLHALFPHVKWNG